MRVSPHAVSPPGPRARPEARKKTRPKRRPIRLVIPLLLFLAVPSFLPLFDPAPAFAQIQDVSQPLSPDASDFFRPAIGSAEVSESEELWYGVYVRGQKLGHAKTSLGKTRQEGRELLAVGFEISFSVMAMGVTADHSAREVQYFDVRPPHVFVRGTSTDSSGRRVEVARNKAGDFEAVIEDRGGRHVEKIGRLDYEYADMRASDLWFREPRAAGDAMRHRVFELSGLKLGVGELKVKEVTRGVAKGVDTTYYAADLRSSLHDFAGAITAEASGTMLAMVMPGQIELRLEPEDVARRRDMPLDLFIQGLVRVDEPLGPAAKIKTLDVRLFGEALGGAMGEAVSGAMSGIGNGPRQTLLGRENDAVTLRLGVGPPQPAGEAEVAEALAKEREFDPADPKIKSLAHYAIGGAIGGAPAARAEAVRRLADFVKDFIKDQAIPQSLTVREIIARRRGDCTEHALLFVALARSLGIPARVVTGLYYMGDHAKAFGGHAWAEIVLDGQWVEVDPTFAQIPPDPLHVRFGAGQRGQTVFTAARGSVSLVVLAAERY